MTDAATVTWRDLPLQALRVSGRARNVLAREMPPDFTVGDLADTPDIDIIRCRNVGGGTLREIRAAIRDLQMLNPSPTNTTTETIHS